MQLAVLTCECLCTIYLYLEQPISWSGMLQANIMLLDNIRILELMPLIS